MKLAYYTQENVEMDGNMRVIEYIKEAAEVIRTADGGSITAAQMLERFLFPPAMQWTLLSKLSGGERRRLYLLRTLMGQPNVLLLDEPTNDLDIQTLTILEDYLELFPGAVITVSHDRYFLDKTAVHLFAFEGGGRVERFDGTYSDYLDKKQAEEALSKETAASAGKPTMPLSAALTAQPVKRPRKLSYKEQKEWDEIEDRIATLEEKLNEVQRQLGQAGADYSKVIDLTEQEKTTASELEHAMERWTELSELVESIENNKS